MSHVYYVVMTKVKQIDLIPIEDMYLLSTILLSKILLWIKELSKFMGILFSHSNPYSTLFPIINPYVGQSSDHLL